MNKIGYPDKWRDYSKLEIVAGDALGNQMRANEFETTRDLGSEWLKRGSSALLRVPSVLVPESANYLLNPLHKDAGLFRIEKSYQYPFDVRLKS